MCGLVGMAGSLEYKDEMTMKRLLVLDFFRGTDSTGLAALRNDGTTRLVKKAVNPLDLFDVAGFKDTLNASMSSVFLGHNRAATKGLVNNMNAHPFECGHIIGAHNGTLTMESWKELEKMAGQETTVDSHAIFLAIEKHGIEAVAPVLQGAWALTWFDTKEKTLNFLRNGKRPFWFAYTKDRRKIFWASEWPMLSAACDMSDQSYDLEISEEGYRFWSTAVDYWYKIKLDDLKSYKQPKDKAKPTVKKLEGKEDAPVTSSAFPRNNVVTHIGTTTPTSPTTGTSLIESHKTKSPSESIISPDTVRSQVTYADKPYGDFFKPEELAGISSHCSWCGEVLDYEAPGLVINVEEGTIQGACCSHDLSRTRVYVKDMQTMVSKKVVGA